jgi:hypothetical protein
LCILKIQTNATETATIICAKIVSVKSIINCFV